MSTLGKESRMKVEELSAKVRYDTITIYLLKAEVRRLKKFEEVNRRLRKYNGDLRHALVTAQGQGQVFQIPDADDGGDGQLFNNETVEEISQTLQVFEKVVFNQIIMDLVLKKLNLKTLKACRLICRNWNEMASSILSRRNGGYGLAVRLEKGKLNGMRYASQRHTIEGLSSVVASASLNWFSKALLDHSFTRRTEIQSVLLDFGYRLRSIEITGGDFLFQDVHKILVDWCPNLEQLALPRWLHSPNENGYQKLVFTRPLKLTSLFMQQQLYISIVKASPNLKTLTVTSDKQSLQFCKDLLTCPEITRNLEHFKLKAEYSATNETIKVFNSIQFSGNLKNLAIKGSFKFRVKELSETLEKLGGTLEKLVLIFIQGMDPDPELIIPGMNNLTELRYFASAKSPIHSIEFLTGMPNLKTLYLGEHHYWHYDRQYFIDNLFYNCEQLRRNPRKKLKELYLFGVASSPSHTFEMMNTIFPNLTKLVVGIFVPRLWNDWEKLKNYYTWVLDRGLSKMLNLKDLYLDFRNPKLEDEDDDKEEFDYMSVVFNKLNKLSNLNRLTIRDNSNSATELVGNKLLEIPNLRQVTLIGIKLDLLAARDLRVLLHQHDILLEIEDTDFKEDFRFHFEEQLELTSRHRQFI